MSFCSNCGTKLLEGDEFCGGCGAKVSDGSMGTQQQGTQQNFQQGTATASSINAEVISKHLKQILDIILAMLIKPASTIKGLIHIVDQKSTIIVAVVLTLIQGIFSLWTMQQFFSMLDKKLMKLATSVSTIMSLIGGGSSSAFDASDFLDMSKGITQVRSLIKIPYGNAFIHGIILYFIVAGLLFLGIFAVAKLIAKTNVDALSIVKVVVFSTIPVLGGEFLKIIISYFNSTLGMLVLLVAILISFATLLICIKDMIEISEDKLVFAITIIYAIVIGCTLFVIWKFVLSDINSIKNSVLKDVMKNFK